NVVEALLSELRTWLAELLSRKSNPEVSVDRPRPASLKVTPWMLSVDLPVSLNTSFRVSPFKRLTPLKDASCAVVLICVSTLLYCATSAEREACEFGSTTGPCAVPLRAVAEPLIAAIVDEAASFVVVRLSLL